ncbi:MULTISPECIES: DUF3597 domain-containing protein [Pseudoxanthomonas]|jgi:hypothetical protein|uniref:DUF3597 domain-containing protein n=1 Tax=Pseudoxanthomonas winnipegensis TaxID=2480810 RepID=A0A4Q8LD51_9GAMM|nr:MULTISPECIES: DUF3597 domain-containing protein [Pseudoxanthomonas]PZP60427.1 MAG: hypothetical protein DI597_13035 [Pseudoxanthomonas spadix]TAA26818.1 DUF3597 domain-containing protein [Pseudoxanthomonas winnipegensis]TMN19473.1 DUF3597 domain-containing protein [Pseudoxanthomonas sp. X-1]UAY75465.1 DUF3597 domain-containing protein [Pseudoxanthomonas sp. X-1]
MGLFSSIVNKIFGHASPQAAAPATPSAASKPEVVIVDGSEATAGIAPPARTPDPATATPAAPVDVAAVLTDIASRKGGKSDWQHSIVDLLKLLDLDSSLTARKELAEELNVHAGEPGSAEQNIALHKAVMKKLAENGGKVPAELKD